MEVPEGSCPGTGGYVPGSIGHDSAGRETGVCPVCGGRFRLGIDSRLPNPHPVPARAG